MRFSNRARRVTSFVTKGLPSRSPPIQEPNWKNGATCQRSVGYACRSARSSLSTARARPRRGSRERSTTPTRSEEHTSELQSRFDLVCRLLLEKKKQKNKTSDIR